LKASKAYIAGLGTTGVLIASFILALVIVSAIVAFNGVLGQASSDRLDRLEVEGESQPADGRRTARLTSRAGDQARRGRADDTARRTRGERARGRPEGRRAGTGSGDGQVDGGVAGATGGSGSGASPAPGATGGGGNTLPRLPNDTGGGGRPQVPEAPAVPPRPRWEK
jgi:hypothetical protein